jgi:predicted N-formylglutamate amidohydrolase
MKLILSCEHGGNKVPEKYQYVFEQYTPILNSHRGYDLGALDVFNALKPLSKVSFFSEESRLLIERNRSLHHKSLFSEFSKEFPLEEKEALIKSYNTYRNSVETAIRILVAKKELVVHISVHSFTPILNTVERNCDIGLLYDSRNRQEKEFSYLLKKEILTLNNVINVRYNYPYLGKADGFTSYLRKQFPENYIGIEIEVNQKFSKENKTAFFLKELINKGLSNALGMYARRFL